MCSCTTLLLVSMNYVYVRCDILQEEPTAITTKKERDLNDLILHTFVNND